MRGQFPVLVVSALVVGPYLTVQKTVEHRHEEALKGRGESEVSGVPTSKGCSSPPPLIFRASFRRILTHAGTNMVLLEPEWQGSGRTVVPERTPEKS